MSQIGPLIYGITQKPMNGFNHFTLALFLQFMEMLYKNWSETLKGPMKDLVSFAVYMKLNCYQWIKLYINIIFCIQLDIDLV